MCYNKQYLGKAVKVKIDRPLGSFNTDHGFMYQLNYGYIPDETAPDKKEPAAYVLGIDIPLENEFEGKCIAILHRHNGDKDKLIIAPEGLFFCDAEIEELIVFQEKNFDYTLFRLYPAVCLMHGFLGFGKTTMAKHLAEAMPAVRFTHDEIMLKRYGRTPSDFQQKYEQVNEFIKKEATKALANHQNVILDYGFLTKELRQQYYDWARAITPNVYFCPVQCDIEVAKQRVMDRTKNNPEELFVDENCFNKLLQQYQPMSKNEKYPQKHLP